MRDYNKTIETINFTCAGVFAVTSVVNFCLHDVLLGIALAGMCVICSLDGLKRHFQIYA